ncbi:ankyrin repeat, SAM and basic leucine zipper domain-containing protein 1-like [Clytia hemisphaerica]|uniref:Uncharacterized protein n=1 Tax=Clytia hemisphaerica TaxID=252671 RepID=A0A7M5VH64_9CNID
MSEKNEKEELQKAKENFAKEQKLMKELIVKSEEHEQSVTVKTDRIKTTGRLYEDTITEDLHSTAGNGDIETLKFLLKKGLYVNSKDINGATPLFCACKENQLHAAVLLIGHGANVNSSCNEGCTPLMYAAWKGHAEIVSLLIKHQADVKAIDDNENTALHFAALGGQQLVCLLLRKAGANKGAKNKKKKTPSDNLETFSQELKVSLTSSFPMEPVHFEKSKSLFGMKRIAREFSKLD